MGACNVMGACITSMLKMRDHALYFCIMIKIIIIIILVSTPPPPPSNQALVEKV